MIYVIRERLFKSRLLLAILVICAFYTWVVFKATHVDLPSPEKPLVFYSNQTRQDLRLTFRKAIQSAKHSIHINMYALTDPLLLKWLKKKASSHLHVTLYFDPRAGHVESAPYFDAIPLKTQGLMHQKILIIDNELVFLGSANMTTSSLVLHDNLTLGFYSPLLAQFLKDPLHHEPHLPRKKIPSHAPLLFQIGSQQGELWLLPDKQGNALARLIQELDSASKTIFISMFTLTHPIITESLISAKKRGVDVRLCIDFYAGRGASSKAIKRLKEENIPILFSQGQQLLHHKWALIDSQKLIVGSTNWTKSAFTKNRDCLLFLKELSSDQRAYLKGLWKIVVSDGRKDP